MPPPPFGVLPPTSLRSWGEKPSLRSWGRNLNRERVLTEAGMATMGLPLAAYEDTAIEITPERWVAWNDDLVLDTIVSLGDDIETHPPSTWRKNLGAEG